jgi:hypothetical protein
MTNETLAAPVGAERVPETVREAISKALMIGGRARVTVTSKATGKHLTVMLAAKKRGEDGRFISRALKAGRVGLPEADVVFADGGDSAWDGWIGRFDPKTGEWRSPKSYDDERGPQYRWAAQSVLRYAVSMDEAWVAQFEGQAEVALASECCVCGKALTDPESIDRGIGPECYGKLTKSSHA